MVVLCIPNSIRWLSTNYVKSIAVGTEPFGIAYNPTNNSIYVTNLANNTVSVIDAAIDVVSTIPLSSFSGAIKIPDSNSRSLLAYVKDNGALYCI